MKPFRNCTYQVRSRTHVLREIITWNCFIIVEYVVQFRNTNLIAYLFVYKWIVMGFTTPLELINRSAITLSGTAGLELLRRILFSAVKGNKVALGQVLYIRVCESKRASSVQQ